LAAPIQSTSDKEEVIECLRQAEREWMAAFLTPAGQVAEQRDHFGKAEGQIRRAVKKSEEQLEREKAYIPREDNQQMPPLLVEPLGTIKDFWDWLATDPNQAGHAYRWLYEAHGRLRLAYRRLQEENDALRRGRPVVSTTQPEAPQIVEIRHVIRHVESGKIEHTWVDPLKEQRAKVYQKQFGLRGAEADLDRAQRELGATEAQPGSGKASADELGDKRAAVATATERRDRLRRELIGARTDLLQQAYGSGPANAYRAAEGAAQAAGGTRPVGIAGTASLVKPPTIATSDPHTVQPTTEAVMPEQLGPPAPAMAEGQGQPLVARICEAHFEGLIRGLRWGF
jgi:hypothetical protein